MAPSNFKNLTLFCPFNIKSIASRNSKELSISVSDANSTASPTSMTDSEPKPNSTPLLGFRRVRSKWLSTIILAAPICSPSNFSPTSPQACSPTSPIPVMASICVSPSPPASPIATTPTKVSEATPSVSEAPSALLEVVSYPAQQLDAVLHKFHYELRAPCNQFLRDPPSSKRTLDAQYKTLSNVLLVEVLFELGEVDVQGDASLQLKRKTLAKIAKGLLRTMDETAMEEHSRHEKMAIERLDEMIQCADEIAQQAETGGASFPMQHQRWYLAGGAKMCVGYHQNHDE